MSRPQLHTSVYPTIAPETLGHANKGKVAVVTGAARGIGQAIAEALAKSGADLALLDLDEARQAETKSRCETFGVKARTYECNVLSVESCERTFLKIPEDLGPIE
ncbi:hypothetical protein H2200_011065 [Cladophialophora chaetospira]|uniref:Uncharacterized protein n=1 Tax=Cladophialophora chaetospira TaxID=386627 RepID=A0AA38WZX0_9EURO|nr:hypothetical protein H2200_011065 [Cladophialophora chaetospira]